MSTRGGIARPVDDERLFVGRYHHWDSYPTGLGSTLFDLIRDQTLGSLEQTLRVLIDDHPAGWSTINGADWSLEPGFSEHGNGVCVKCGEPDWKHWIQNYESHGLPKPEPYREGTYQAFDHTTEHDFDAPKRPECYCHGDRSEEEWELTAENSSGGGVEWVYVIDVETRQMVVMSSYTTVGGKYPEGVKMIGAWGMGDPDAEWKPVATIDLDGPEPDWKEIESVADEEEVEV